MNRFSFGMLAVLSLVLPPRVAFADDEMHAHYLANAGVLVTYDDTKVIFDPLFDNDYGTYERVPADIEQDLFAAAAPFDGIDAVFVSHHHGDHFSPDRMLQLLRSHPDLQLFAPTQAITALPLTPHDDEVRRRINAVSLDFDGQYTLDLGGIVVNAVRIPHSGYPARHVDVENLAFHVTLHSGATVLHMGDAHSDDRFYANQSEYWAERDTLLVLPPYWMFMSDGGQAVLEHRVDADVEIGVHVPKNMPDRPSNYPPELQGRKLFSVPGQSEVIVVNKSDGDAN